MNRGRFASLIVFLFFAISSGGLHAQSIVDYLNGKGHASDFESRKELWTQYRPSEKYTGTAKQNTSLLNALKIDDLAPQLQLTEAIYRKSEPVHARVGKTPVVIESELGQFSTQGKPGEIISLGDVRGAGVFSLRVIDGKNQQHGLLFLHPQDGKFNALLLLAPRVVQQASPGEIQESPELIATVKKFSTHFSGDRLKSAARKVAVPWLADNVGSLGTTVVVCAVGAGLAPESGGVSLAPCVYSASGEMVDLSATIMREMLKDMNDVLTRDEIQLLDKTFILSNAGVQLGLSLGSGKNAARACKAADPALTAADTASTEISNDVARMTIKMSIQESRKVVMLLCLERK